MLLSKQSSANVAETACTWRGDEALAWIWRLYSGAGSRLIGEYRSSSDKLTAAFTLCDIICRVCYHQT